MQARVVALAASPRAVRGVGLQAMREEQAVSDQHDDARASARVRARHDASLGLGRARSQAAGVIRRIYLVVTTAKHLVGEKA